MNHSKSITFLFPLDGATPYGGYKVVYEYANRLCKDGFIIHIAYPALRFVGKQTFPRLFRMCLKYLYYKFIKGYTCHSWFPLNNKIAEHYLFSLDYRFVPKTDYYFATSIETALFLKTYPISNHSKYYLIQGFENWAMSDDAVKETYRYGFINIVVSSWLEDVVINSGSKCITIKNGFDFDYFKLCIPPLARSRFQIAMMYSNNSLKGCEFGLAALEQVKRKYTELKVYIFGVSERPQTLPDYMEYYRRPNRETFNRIYNESAIYLAPSIEEGFGLTIGEAMICGCAVVCTNNKGFMEMAEDGITALISPVRNSQSLADNIIRLIEDNDLRIRIANEGNTNIRHFSWDESYAKLKALL